MKSAVDRHYWASREDCADDHVLVTYQFQTSLDPVDAATNLAKEQSLGGAGIPRSRLESLIKVFGAKCINDSISGPDETGPNGRFTVMLAFPLTTLGGMLAPFCNAAIGEIHNIAAFQAVRVIDVIFPNRFTRGFEGPAFGVKGLRNSVGEPTAPLLIGPVKPCIGLTPREFSRFGADVLHGGFHAIKDDELLVETKNSGFAERIAATAAAVAKVEDQTGEKKLYFAHIGGDSTRIDDLFDIAQSEGATGIMVSPGINGIDIAQRYRGKLPIISHNSLFYASSRNEDLGVKFGIWAKIQRLAGADILVTPGKFGSFDIMSETEHGENASACLDSLGHIQQTLPAFSGSQTPETMLRHLKLLGTTDFGMIVGGAAYGHPEGRIAGAAAFRQAWSRAKDFPELR